MAAKSCRKIEVLETANNIIKTIMDAKEPLNVAALAKLTGYSTDIVFRQVGTMYDLHWVEKVGDGYIPGSEMWLFRARVKSSLEAQRDVIDRKLTEAEEG